MRRVRVRAVPYPGGQQDPCPARSGVRGTRGSPAYCGAPDADPADGTYLGAITLRHGLNDFLLRAGGHIGYGLRPSARGRGLATWALRSVLVRAPELGLRTVLVTCGDSNLASARVIEKAGGVLEDVRETELGLTRRYWITL